VSAQSITAFSNENSSDASVITSIGCSSCRIWMPRACVSRLRCASTPRSTCVSDTGSRDSRSRPEARRASCWLTMPASRACATASRSARRPWRSIWPVLINAWIRSSAPLSGPAISAPSCWTMSPHCESLGRCTMSLAASGAATVGGGRDMLSHSGGPPAACRGGEAPWFRAALGEAIP